MDTLPVILKRNRVPSPTQTKDPQRDTRQVPKLRLAMLTRSVSDLRLDVEDRPLFPRHHI